MSAGDHPSPTLLNTQLTSTGKDLPEGQTQETELPSYDKTRMKKLIAEAANSRNIKLKRNMVTKYCKKIFDKRRAGSLRDLAEIRLYMEGRITARWQRNQLLVKDSDGERSRSPLSSDLLEVQKTDTELPESGNNLASEPLEVQKIDTELPESDVKRETSAPGSSQVRNSPADDSNKPDGDHYVYCNTCSSKILCTHKVKCSTCRKSI